MLHENLRVSVIETEAIGTLKDIHHRLGDFAELMLEKTAIMLEMDAHFTSMDLAREQTLFVSVRKISKLVSDLIKFMNYNSEDFERIIEEEIAKKKVLAGEGDIEELLEFIKMLEEKR